MLSGEGFLSGPLYPQLSSLKIIPLIVRIHSEHHSTLFFAFLGFGGICPPGKYCPPGSGQPIGCPPGSYQDETGKTYCKSCPVGYYCYENTTHFSPYICPKGHFCTINTTMPYQHKCWPGTYNPFTRQTNSSACLVCDAGKYCKGYGLERVTDNCYGGYYCPGGARNETMIKCPTGYFAPNGSSDKIPCPGGKYCAHDGLSAPTYDCAGGYYCTLRAYLANPTDNVTGNICPRGKYCPMGTEIPKSCPIGMFLNSTGNR